MLSTVASAATVCPFSVLGRSVPYATTDAVALMRYAKGLRGQNLTPGLASLSDGTVVESNISANQSRLDLDGDGVFGVTDATLIARHLLGFRGSGLVSNTASSSGMVEAFIAAGCPQRAAAPPEPALIEWLGTRDTVDAANLQLVAIGIDAEKVVAASIGNNVCQRTLGGGVLPSVRFDCRLPQSVSSPFSVVNATVTYVDGSTALRGANWIAPLAYWESVNGVMYVSDVSNYLIESYTDRGPQINMSWGSTSGLIADVIAFPPGTQLRLFGSQGETRCAIRQAVGLSTSYQCPPLASGNYVAEVLFDAGTRLLAGAGYAIKVIAIPSAAPLDPVSTSPPNVTTPPGCNPAIRKECD